MKILILLLILTSFLSLFSEQLIGYRNEEFGLNMYVPESYNLLNKDKMLVAINDSIGLSLGYYFSLSDKTPVMHLLSLEEQQGTPNQLDSADIVFTEEDLANYNADFGIKGFYSETSWEGTSVQSVTILKKDDIVVMISMRISGNPSLEDIEMITDCISLFKFTEQSE